MFYIILGEIDDSDFLNNFIIEITEEVMRLGKMEEALFFKSEEEATSWLRDKHGFAYPQCNLKVLSENEISVIEVMI